MRVLLTLFAATSLYAQVEVIGTLIPVTDRGVITAAYGNLPKNLVVWNLTLTGPTNYEVPRQILGENAHPHIKKTQAAAVGLKSQRLSLLTWTPAVSEYGGWIGGSFAKSSTKKALIPVIGFAVAKALEYVPFKATAEKLSRLEADLCPDTGDIGRSQSVSCVILTINIGVPVTGLSIMRAVPQVVVEDEASLDDLLADPPARLLKLE